MDPKRTRLRLWQKQEGICPWCDQPIDIMDITYPFDRPGVPWTPEATIDHKRPRSHGGGNDMANLQLMHKSCNQEKGDSCVGCPRCTAETHTIDIATITGKKTRYHLVTVPEYRNYQIARSMLGRIMEHGPMCRCKVCKTLTDDDRAFLARIPYPYMGA